MFAPASFCPGASSWQGAMSSAATIAKTPAPPYYAVIFTSLRTDGDQGYDEMAQRMIALAFQMPGFLGVESVRSADGLGITVSYWQSEDAIRQWKAHSEHRLVQEAGGKIWYSDYVVRVAKVERVYGMVTNKAAH
jgi:heme-degrading monooxygenase HmoA